MCSNGRFSSHIASSGAARAADVLTHAIHMLELEESTLQERFRQCQKEVQLSQQAMLELKQAAEDNTVLVASTDPKVLPLPRPSGAQYYYCANCKVGGHGQRFCEYLLQRPDWRIYPSQVWFKDEKGAREYLCPLGRHSVDFTDETRFSRVSMYIRGHIWMEDKTKLYEVVPEKMPHTYIIEDQQWKHGRKPPPDEEAGDLPWFVKEADRNWGTSVHCCRRPSECISLVKPGALYAVQQHIADPLCMSDGRKCHIKFYILLLCHEDRRRGTCTLTRMVTFPFRPILGHLTIFQKKRR